VIIDLRKDPESEAAYHLGYGTHKVMVDGVECQDVFFVDTEAGVVEYYLRNKQGNFYLVEGGEVAACFAKGKVEIVPLAVTV